MRPTRANSSHLVNNKGSRCEAVAATWAGSAKPLLYMLMSTAMILLLALMFSQSFVPHAWHISSHRSNQVSHVGVPVHAQLMRI